VERKKKNEKGETENKKAESKAGGKITKSIPSGLQKQG